MQILITGGTGLIGRHLIPRLLILGHQVTVVTRNPDNARQILDSRVTLWKGWRNVSTSMRLMPSSIWRANRLRQALDVATKRTVVPKPLAITQKLVDLIHASATPPSVLISGSATGYYGDLGDVVVTEDERRTTNLRINFAPAGNRLPVVRRATRPASACCVPALSWRRKAGFWGKWFRRFASDSAVRWVMVGNIWLDSH